MKALGRLRHGTTTVAGSLDDAIRVLCEFLLSRSVMMNVATNVHLLDDSRTTGRDHGLRLELAPIAVQRQSPMRGYSTCTHGCTPWSAPEAECSDCPAHRGSRWRHRPITLCRSLGDVGVALDPLKTATASRLVPSTSDFLFKTHDKKPLPTDLKTFWNVGGVHRGVRCCG